MDRARDADILWRNGERLFAKSPWVYDPNDICNKTFGELADALRQSGVSQRHGPDSAAWRTIAESLLDERSPQAVRRAVYEGVGDARELIPAIRSLRNGRPWFPFLAGPKISEMWVRILALPGGATISNLDVIEVAVDVQVRKVSENLRVTNTAGHDLESVRSVIQRAWRAQATDVVAPGPLNATAAGLDPALWFMGKWGCTFCQRAGRAIPVSPICDRCVHREG